MPINPTVIDANLQASNISTSRIRVNDQTYEFGLTLFNSQGIAFPINTAALVNLTIEEDSREWYKKGTLIINNKDNILERRPNEYTSKDAMYKFRNDGRDILFINIKPVVDGGNNIMDLDPFPSKAWELSYICSVYDVEDLPGEKPNEKNIKLYFWEYDYQLFVETTVANWSSNNVLYNNIPSLNGKSSILPDEVRKVSTGDAIQDLINNVLTARSGPQTFRPDWDPGAGTIFYAPPPGNNAIDDLDYLFNRHVASDTFDSINGDVPLLYRSRYDKEWALTSLVTELSFAVDSTGAGPLQLEQFYLTATDSTGVIIPSLLKTPQSLSNSRNLNLGGTSSINNFQFVDMSALDNTFGLINVPCASNNIKKKQFNIEMADNAVDNVKDYFQTNYIESFSNNKNPTALFSLNKSKTQSLSYKHVYSYASTKTDRYADSRNLILKTGFFLNQCINFTVNGSTLRRANSFIGLDRAIGSVDSDFDEKLLGQWYVIKATHIFTQEGYKNNITAVKPHADKNIRIDDNVI